MKIKFNTFHFKKPKSEMIEMDFLTKIRFVGMLFEGIINLPFFTMAPSKLVHATDEMAVETDQKYF